MRLTIDLNDPLSVANGAKLLAMWSGLPNSPSLGFSQSDSGPEVPVISHADNPATGMRSAAEVFAPSQASIPVTGAGVNTFPPLPTGAPSFVGAGQSPTVPAVPLPPVGANATAVPPAPAPYIAPAVHAQTLASAAAPASHAHAAGVELDKNGLPWDERIHTSTKAKNQDGSWRSKRGVNDEAMVKRVEAELRAMVAGGGVAAPAAPVVPAPPQVAAPLGVGASGGQPSPSIPPVPSVATPAPSAPALVIPAASTASPSSFEDFVSRLTAGAAAGHVHNDAPNAVAVHLGLTSLVGFQERPELIPQAWALLKQNYPALV